MRKRGRGEQPTKKRPNHNHSHIIADSGQLCMGDVLLAPK